MGAVPVLVKGSELLEVVPFPVHLAVGVQEKEMSFSEQAGNPPSHPSVAFEVKDCDAFQQEQENDFVFEDQNHVLALAGLEKGCVPFGAL